VAGVHGHRFQNHKHSKTEGKVNHYSIVTLIGDLLWVIGSIFFWIYILSKIDNKNWLIPTLGVILGVIGYGMSVITRINWWQNTPGGYASKAISSWMDGSTILLVILMIAVIALDEKVQAKSFSFRKIYDKITDIMFFFPFVAFVIGIAFRIAKIYLPFFL
jgi:hypothetical protein